MGAEPEPGGPSLCDALTLDELNTASGRGFDQAEGDAAHCAWTSSDPAAALDAITATVTGLTLDEFREIVGSTEAIDIGGVPAISTPTRAVIELPDDRTLDVSVYYDERVEPTHPADVLALMLVERLAPAVAAEAPAAGDGVPDSSD
jgi:hypothetical protein